MIFDALFLWMCIYITWSLAEAIIDIWTSSSKDIEITHEHVNDTED